MSTVLPSDLSFWQEAQKPLCSRTPKDAATIVGMANFTTPDTPTLGISYGPDDAGMPLVEMI